MSGPVMWGNVPVPYIAAWSGEWPPETSEVRVVPALGGHPFLVEGRSTPGVGKPLFSTFHVGRAIEVLVDNVCQICRAALVGHDRFCIGDARCLVRKRYPHITDGLPMCEGCTATALRLCPGLARYGDSLRIWRAREFGLAPAALGIVPEAEGGNPAVNAALRAWRGRRPVFGTPKIYLTAFAVVDPARFGGVGGGGA